MYFFLFAVLTTTKKITLFKIIFVSLTKKKGTCKYFFLFGKFHFQFIFLFSFLFSHEKKNCICEKNENF